MSGEYVQRRNGAYHVAGSRVSLDSIVYESRNGELPEAIRENFPSLSLEQVYGAITYYLAHRDEIDAYLKQGEHEFSELQERACRSNGSLIRKVREAQRLNSPS
jgi:uncharacterized protein (DUF433 family)